MVRFILSLLACSAIFYNAQANVKPNSLFGDHMILQEGVPVKVWGTADEGENVTVSFNGQVVSTITKNGKWSVTLAAMPYVTKPSDMIITGKDTVVLKDILVGEVWLCSGQSNMERQLGPRPPQPLITDWEQERDAANYPLIREYYVPLNYAKEKVDDANGQWTVCSPQTVSDFSAVGYFFAKNLYKHLQVPVGIIFSAYGGTPAEDWTSKEALEANSDLLSFTANYDSIIKSQWHPKGFVKNGLYNGMIHPLLPYSLKGVAWYQGESNVNRDGQYENVLTNMIHNWRNDFKQGDLPFLIVQIAPHKDMTPELREAQLLVSKKVDNTALIVTTDVGDANDIHPPRKQPVGRRLALAARALAYDEDIEDHGPIYKSHKIKGNKVWITFNHIGKGLSTKADDHLKGFTIAGPDKKFVPANAKIKGNKVIVSNPAVQNPVAVRYGWANVPNVNLINKDELPASPFRTDLED